MLNIALGTEPWYQCWTHTAQSAYAVQQEVRTDATSSEKTQTRDRTQTAQPCLCRPGEKKNGKQHETHVMEMQ